MKYYKGPNPYISNDEIATEYIEVDSDNIIMRQLSILDGWYISSNVDLVLGELPFEDEDLEDNLNGILPVTADEFNSVWQKYLEHHEARWMEAKKSFPINKQVVGCMKIFFPQGIIVQLSPQVFGVTDYMQARATVVSPEFIMGTRYQIGGIVTGYDEINQWIKLGSPQIYPDKNCYSDTWRTP